MSSHEVTPLKTKMTLQNHHFSIGNTSSNGGSSIVMLVFRGGKFPQYFVGAKDGCHGA